jgi:hypothetical protein
MMNAQPGISSMTPWHPKVLGWFALGLSTLASCYWAVWGILENFHEGWYYTSLWRNLGLMLVQYLLPMLLFVAAALVAVRWPRIGGGLHIGAAVAAAWFFRGESPIVIFPFIVSPLAFMGILYWFGTVQPLRRAVVLIAGLPLIVLLICGAEPAYRVAGRLDDGDLSARHVAGNGVELIWAPEGPGWPLEGVSWGEAVRRCRYLSEDGTFLMETPQDVWRLPTVEEAVRSMQRHGHKSGGTWDASHSRPSYILTPDKESPLWNVHSKVIYWWTATGLNEREAYIIVYDGKVWRRSKRVHWGYLGFRAVENAAKKQ